MFGPNTIYTYEHEELRIRDCTREFRMTARPCLTARHRLHGQNWFPAEPNFRVIQRDVPRKNRKRPDHKQLHLELDDKSRSRRPTGIREDVLPFFRAQIPVQHALQVEPYFWDQWRCLVFLERFGEAAIELLTNSPQYGFVFANVFCGLEELGKPSAPQRIQNLLRGKQRDALAFMRLPPEKRVLKFLAKWDLRFLDRMTLTRLDRLMNSEEERNNLAHLPRINCGVYSLNYHPELRRMVSFGLMQEVCMSEQEDNFPFMETLLLELSGLRTRYPTQFRNLPRFRSLEHFREVHGELLPLITNLQEREEEQRRRLEQSRLTGSAIPREFPPPPLPSTDQFIAITTVELLRKEGREMEHCVGSYSNAVRRGRVYVYKVIKPERATLSLIKGCDGFWRLGQLYLKRNQGPAPETQGVVQNWIRTSSNGA